jgi:hypothetical protein
MMHKLGVSHKYFKRKKWRKGGERIGRGKLPESVIGIAPIKPDTTYNDP